MNRNVKIEWIWLCFFVLVSFMGASNALGQQNVEPPGSSESQPVDSTFVRDEIDMNLVLKNGDSFRIVTRPGHTVFISEVTPEGKIIRKGLAVMPEPVDKELKSITREEVLLLERDEFSFLVLPVCINSTAAIAQMSDAEARDPECIPWSAKDRSEDQMFPFVSKQTTDIGLAQPFIEQLTGAQVEIVDYRITKNFSLRRNNPFGKCCLDGENVQVCACVVAHDGRECNAGCLGFSDRK